MLNAFLLLQVFEFNDVDDTARIDQINNQSNIYELKLKNFNWHHKDMSKIQDFVEFYAEADAYKDPETNDTRKGSLKFTVRS